MLMFATLFSSNPDSTVPPLLILGITPETAAACAVSPGSINLNDHRDQLQQVLTPEQMDTPFSKVTIMLTVGTTEQLTERMAAIQGSQAFEQGIRDASARAQEHESSTAVGADGQRLDTLGTR